MSRITQDQAKQVSIDMTKSLKDKLDYAKITLSELMSGIMYRRTPQVIIEAHKKHPSYFDTISTVYVQGKGFTGQPIPTSDKFISSNDNYSTTIDITDDEHNILWDAYIDHENVQKQYDKLRSTISNTIYQLRTYSQITQQFPEAVPFLPTKTTTALSIPINDIRAQLKAAQ